LRWLPWAKFCYNSAFQSSHRTSLFHVVYGHESPQLCAYTTGEAKPPAVDTQLCKQDEFLMEVRDRLEQVQQYYKHYYDHKHRPSEFTTGNWVWLRLLHWPLASLDIKGKSKLGPKFFGPFQIAGRVGEVAYKLKLPESARLHDMFHVGMLKKFHGTPPVGLGQLPPVKNGRACIEFEAVTKS
jgi:hypothetical protein